MSCLCRKHTDITRNRKHPSSAGDHEAGTSLAGSRFGAIVVGPGRRRSLLPVRWRRNTGTHLVSVVRRPQTTQPLERHEAGAAGQQGCSKGTGTEKSPGENAIAAICQMMVRNILEPEQDLPEGVCNIDAKIHDEFHPYFPQVMRYLKHKETTHSFRPDFLTSSKITPSTRSTLVDWMIKVQLYLNLRTESLQLAVSLLDNFVNLRVIRPQEYQLYGITSLFVAAKVVERFPPPPKKLCLLTENVYTPQQMLQAELEFLATLEFNLNVPLPGHFLYRNLLACFDIEETCKLELFCLYLFDLILIDYASLQFAASLRAAAAIWVGRMVFYPDLPRWTKGLEHYTGWQDRGLVDCCDRYLVLLRQMTGDEDVEFEAAFHKFGSKRYNSISTDRQLVSFCHPAAPTCP